jgi:ABC-2 type transport system permease protein
MGNRFSLRWDHIRALLWLRWKLTLRGYTRSTRQIVGFIFTLIFLLGLAAVFSVGTAAGYLLLDRQDAAQLLFIVLAGVWVAWVAFPLMQYTLNEGLDVTKLQIYPLTRGEQMVSLLLATLFDMSAIVLVSLLVAVAVGWHASLSAVLVTLVALALAYLLIVTTSQLLLAALMGILRSRRFRDLSVVFFALFGVSCALINQFVSRAMIGFQPNEFVSLHLDRYLQWLPTGMGARAIVLADQGDPVAALPWLGMMLALVLVMVVVWAWVLDRGITTAESAGGGVRRRARRGRSAIALDGAVAVTSPARTGWRLFSGPVLAIADKDRRYFWRDPQIKASLISTLFLLIFVMLPSLFSGRPVEVGSPEGGFGLPIASWQVFLAPIPALFITINLAQNAFGLEREGLQTLFLFPVRPLDILRGKNLAVGVVALSAAVLMTLAVAALGGSWSNAPIALGYAISAIFVLLGCGNFISVFIPMRVRRMRMGQGNFAASGNGCLRTILMVVATQATYVLLLPVAAALLLPLILSHPEWLVVTLPASLLYAAVFYELVTRFAASQLLKRAPDILMATMPDN